MGIGNWGLGLVALKIMREIDIYLEINKNLKKKHYF